MTQESFLAQLPTTWLLDTCCPMNLDGKNQVLDGQASQVPLYSDEERRAIWAGLESLANEGRLKLIREVKQELRRLYPESLARLDGYKWVSAPRVGTDLQWRYQALLSKYPDLTPEDDLTHDPADPWLIVTAQKYSYAILSDEVREKEKKGRVKHGPQIPDICDAENIDCKRLRELANDEGWLK